jgi:hypothetical protein
MITRKFKNDSKCGNRVAYVFGKNHEHKCDSVTFAGGNVYSDKAEDLAREMEIPTNMRRSATDKGPGLCGAHYMISLRPGEKLTVEEWKDVLDTTMTNLGYGKDHKYFGVIHENTEKQHMHIVANRISMDNYLLVNESKDYETLIDSARDLEIKYKHKIEPTTNPEDTWGVNELERDVKNFGREWSKYESELKKNPAPPKPNVKFRNIVLARVAASIEEAHAIAERKSTKKNPVQPTMVQFVAALKKREIDVKFTIKEGTTEITGITYIFDGRHITGRELKRSRLTFQKLIEQEGISYEPEKHFSALQRAVQFRAGESKESKHEKDLEKRRSGGNLPSGVARYDQINADDYMDAASGPRHRLSKKKEQKPKDEYFAIRVTMQKYHYAIARRMMPPTRVNSQYMIFAFKKDYREVRTEIETNRIIRLMHQMLSTLMTFFGIFKAQCELVMDFEYSPTSDGPIYTSHIEEQPPSLTPNIRLQQLRTTFQTDLSC